MDSLIIWRDKAWSGGFYISVWFTFFGFSLTAYSLFYAGLDDIGIRVLISGIVIGLLSLPFSVWTFRKGRTLLSMNVDWENNRLLLDCVDREINIETLDRISGFKISRSTGDYDASVTIATAMAGSPIVMREEDWYVCVLYEMEKDNRNYIWHCNNKREGEKIVKKLNQLLHTREQVE
jgi:hypothetical protein